MSLSKTVSTDKHDKSGSFQTSNTKKQHFDRLIQAANLYSQGRDSMFFSLFSGNSLFLAFHMNMFKTIV